MTHHGGVRFAAQVRSHRVLVDQPVHGGGDDTAPSPIELLGASLGTCVALYVKQFCEVRGLPYEGMRVEVETVGAANPIASVASSLASCSPPSCRHNTPR